jgi:hypothetical protein
MMDDDLEKLLRDVDGDSDYLDIKQNSRQAARIEEIDAELNEAVADTTEVSTEKINKLEVDEDILIFKSGISYVIDKHNGNANDLLKMISDKSVSEGIYEILKKYKYTFTRHIDKITEICEQYGKTLSDVSLSKEAKRDFNLFFEGVDEDNKIDFLILKEIFIRLKEFNSTIMREWRELGKSIGVINLTVEGKQLYLEMNDIFQNAQGLCANTEKFLQRIGVILDIQEDDYDAAEKDINKKIIYHDAISYRYDDIFISPEIQSELKDPDASFAEEAEAEGEIEVESQEHIEEIPDDDYVLKERRGDEHAGDKPQEYRETVEGSFSPAIKFTIRGTRSWNTRVPYVIRMNSEKLERDYSDLSNSFIFLDDSVTGSNLEDGIRIAMLKFLRDRTQNITEGYRDFIIRIIDFHVGEISDFFDFKDEKLILFIYHLGPFSIYRVIINRLQNQKIGYCYKHLDGNRVSKFIPFEFIKGVVLEWFEKNINEYDLQFDRIQEFDEFRRTVSKRYYAEMDRISNVLDEVIKKSNLEYKTNINRLELFRSKWNQWFGLANIVIYKRFIEKTIF